MNTVDPSAVAAPPQGLYNLLFDQSGDLVKKLPDGSVVPIGASLVITDTQTNTIILGASGGTTSVSVNNEYTFPIADGLIGQYLTTDGAGNLSWNSITVDAGLGGSGTTNFVAKFTGATQVGDSSLYESGGNVAIGTQSTTEKFNVSGNVRVNGQVYIDVPTTHIPSGTTQTIDWNNGNFQTIDLGSATGNVTLTFNNPKVGAFYTLKVIQGPTARQFTYPASVKWGEGISLVPSITNDAVDIINMIYDGTYYLSSYMTNIS